MAISRSTGSSAVLYSRWLPKRLNAAQQALAAGQHPEDVERRQLGQERGGVRRELGGIGVRDAGHRRIFADRVVRCEGRRTVVLPSGRSPIEQGERDDRRGGRSAADPRDPRRGVRRGRRRRRPHPRAARPLGDVHRSRVPRPGAALRRSTRTAWRSWRSPGSARRCRAGARRRCSGRWAIPTSSPCRRTPSGRTCATRRTGRCTRGSASRCSTPSTSTSPSSTRPSGCCGRPRSSTRRWPRPTRRPTTAGSATSAATSRASSRPPTCR